MARMTDLTVPKTILEQLGGNDFIARTGATAFISTEDSLTFRAGRNSNSVSHVRITLTATDLYAVTLDYVFQLDAQGNGTVAWTAIRTATPINKISLMIAQCRGPS